MHAQSEDWRQAAQHFRFGDHRIAFWTHHQPDSDARPLLLVHGFPTCSWDWAAIWPLLGKRRDLIACDMLGFGLSDKPRAGYSIHRQADLHEALLAHLGVTQWDALVHDYGVSVGQELLARQLDGSGASGLGQMIFLNGGIFPDQHRPRPIQRLGTSPLGFLVSRMLSRKGFGQSFSEVFGPDTQPSEAELDEFWGFITEKRGHRIFHRLLHYIADRRANEARWVGALKQAQPRIGLINGGRDPVSGEHAWRAWCERLPDARQLLLPRIGHYPQVEAPNEVAAQVREWLDAAPRAIRAGSRRAVRGS